MKRLSFTRLLAVLLLCLPVSVMAMGALEQQQKDKQNAAKASTADLIKQLEDLQKQVKSSTHGWGFLDIVRNGTIFDATFVVEKQTAIEEKLGKGATIRIKALTGPYKDMYFTITKDGQFKPTIKDPNDKATLFEVDRYADLMLNEWFGIKYPPQSADANYLQCSSDQTNKRLRLITPDAESNEYTSLTNNDAHFKIVGDDVDLCRIVSANGGNVHMATYRRLEQGEPGKPTKFYDPNETWAVESNWDLSSLAAGDESGLIKFNTPIAIKETAKKDITDDWDGGPGGYYLKATLGDRRPMMMGEGWSAGPGIYKPAHYFILRKAGFPTSVAPVCYGDRVEVVVVAPNQNDINPAGAKICVTGKDQLLNIAVPGGNQQQHLNDGMQIFRLVNPDNPNDTAQIKHGSQIQVFSTYPGFEDYGWQLWNGSIYSDMHWTVGLNLKGSNYGGRNFSVWDEFSRFAIENAPPKVTQFRDFPFANRNIYDEVVQAFGLNALKTTRTFRNNAQIDTSGLNLAQVTAHYQRDPSTKKLIPGRAADAWGVTTARRLVACPAGGSWSDQGSFARWVSAGAEDGVWYVTNDYTVERVDISKTLGAPPAGIVQVAGQLRGGNEYVYALGKDGSVYRFNGKSWEDAGIATVVNIAMSYGKDSPIVWAVNNLGELKSYDTGLPKGAAWGTQKAPAVGLLQVAPRGYYEERKKTSNGKDEVIVHEYQYGIGKDKKLYSFDGNAWSPQVDNRGFVTCMSGIYDGRPPSTYVIKSYEVATTANIPEGNPLIGTMPEPEDIVDGNPVADPKTAFAGIVGENDLPLDTDGLKAPVTIELVTPGMGGSLPGNGGTFPFSRFPIASRQPRIIGYGAMELKNFTSSSMLTLTPMRGRGAAWIGQTLKNPGNATVNFLARSDGGGVHVIFGTLGAQKMPWFDWRVVIGGGSGSDRKSWIEKGTINKDGKFASTRVYEVSAKDNPLAAGSPGNFVPYAVSIDDGLILVTMGGSVFMAWRDPDSSIPSNTVGFGSDDSKVDVTQIQVLPPMVAVPPKRLFVQASDTVSLSPDPEAITWVDYPFRVPDEGSIAFSIQGEEKVALALGQDQDRLLPHYLITFGDVDDKGNDGISIKKWQADKQIYLLRAFLPSGPYEEIKKRSDIDPAKALSFKLDPAKKLDAWVSFKDGQIFVGLGDEKHIGSNVVMVLNDINPYIGIKTVGFGAMGTKPATVEGIAIADNVSLNFEKAAELYKMPVTQFQVKGDIDIIKPFELQIAQVDDRIVVQDAIANKNYLTAATPNPGKNYTFMVDIQPDGYPKFAASKGAEDSDIKIMAQELMTAVDAQTALLSAQKDSIKAQGELAQKLGTAASEEQKAQADAILRTNDATNAAAATVIESTGKNPLTANIGMGVGVAMMVAGTVITSTLANQRLNEAAALDKTGKEAAVAAEARAQTLDDAAAQLAYAKNLAEGSASAAFEKEDGYVYTDKVTKDTTGKLTVPAEATANAKIFKTNVDAAAKLLPITEKNIEQFVTTMQTALDAVTHAAVVQDGTLKKKAYTNLSKLLDAYETLLGKAGEGSATQELYNEIITLLFTAYNNVVFADETVPAEKKEKDSWYTGINEIARTLLADPKLAEFKVDAWYGAPVFFPKKLDTPDRGSISFKVKGSGDLMIGFAKTPGNIRNVQPAVDVYEVVINGCGGTTTGVRFESLGKMIGKITTDDNPAAGFNALDWQEYWVNLDNGKIEVGTGALDPKNVILTVEDRYPVGGFASAYISSWTDEVAIKDIVFGRSMYDTPPAPAPAPRPTVEINKPVAAVKKDVATVVAATNKKVAAGKPKAVKIVAPKAAATKAKPAAAAKAKEAPAAAAKAAPKAGKAVAKAAPTATSKAKVNPVAEATKATAAPAAKKVVAKPAAVAKPKAKAVK